MKFSSIKKQVKRLMLASMVEVLIPMTALAGEGLEGDNQGGGGTGIGDNAEYAHKFMAYPENQGYRISIVDKDGNRVANSVDIVNYVPADLWNGKALPGGNSSNPNETYLPGFNQYRNFVGWEDGRDKVSNFLYSNAIKTEAYSSTVWNKNGVPVTPAGIETHMYPRELFEQFFNTRLMEYVAKYNAEKHGNEITAIPPTFKITLPAIIDGSTFRAGGMDLKNIMETKLVNKNSEEVSNYAARLVNMTSPQFDWQGNPSGASDFLFKFANSSEQSLVGTKGADGVAITQSSIMQQKGYRLIMEPLYWYVPELLTTDPVLVSLSKRGVHFAHVNYVVYGTVSYISKFVEQELSSIWSDSQIDQMWCGPDWGGAKLGVTALMVSKGYTDIKLLEPSSAGLTPRSGAGWNNSFSLYSLAHGDSYKTIGYSVHVYDKVWVTNNISTSTWDQTNHPTDRGPAPEPPTTSEGEDYKKVNKDHIRNIVKFYGEKQADGSIVYQDNYVRTKTVSTISIVNEKDYVISDYFTSSKYEAPSGPSASYDDFKSRLPKGSFSGSKEGTIILTPESTDTTLYVKLLKEKAPAKVLGDINVVTLYENELSYPYSLYSFREKLEELYYNFPDKSHSGSGSHSSTHHEQGPDGQDREYTEHWSCSWSRSLSDSSYRINMNNQFNYGSTTFIGNSGPFAGREDGKIDTSDGERSASISGFQSVPLNPNWRFIYYRDNAQDKVTLYPEGNTSKAVSELSQLGIGVGDYGSLAPGRKANEGAGLFNNTFPLNYQYGSIDKTLSWDSHGCSEHGDSGSYDGSESKSPNAINGVYGVANALETAYYTGKANTGTTSPAGSDSKFTFDGKEFTGLQKVNGGSDSNFVFYPYVKMLYQNINGEAGQALVKSTNLSTVAGYTSVDAVVYRSNAAKPELGLQSELWNTHQRTQSFLDEEKIQDKASVLPGGAFYTLQTANSGDASSLWLGLHSYQVCIDDTDVKKLASSNVLTKSKAEQNLTAFYTESKDILGKYQIEQWVAPGLYKTQEAFVLDALNKGKAIKVSGNGHATYFKDTKNTYSLSTDSKYYFKTDNGSTINKASDSSRLNVLAEKDSTIYWYITSDETGKVRVRNTAGVDKSISKTQGVSSLLSDVSIKVLDDKTKVVTNYVNALDRNVGSDRNGVTWYNEGFGSTSSGTGGLMVVESYKAYNLGFGNGGNEIRGTVLDTKLTGYTNDSGDIFNYYGTDGKVDSNKVRTSMFLTSPSSEGASGNTSYIGTLNGKSVKITYAEYMLQSKIFYIPNATVMDLD